MKYIFILILLIFNACLQGPAGEDGAPGTDGRDGKDGLNGRDTSHYTYEKIFECIDSNYTASVYADEPPFSWSIYQKTVQYDSDLSNPDTILIYKSIEVIYSYNGGWELECQDNHEITYFIYWD